jgi:phosphoserine aminotransferase
MLPEAVLQRAAAEMMDYNGSGQSVMEMSHRSKVYEEIINGCEALLREIMGIPDNYKVLFLQGGASSQFAMLPLNLMNGSGKADFVITGQWANKAYQEASRYGEANVIASSKDKTFSYIPEWDEADFTPDADYFHICMNNTIYGTKFHKLPETGDVPLIADVSSCILSEPIDVSKFGMIYAGVQKNLAPAGLAIVIVREDLIGNAMPITPMIWDYALNAEKRSMINTPPCFPIYFVKLVTDYLMEQGGLAEMKKRNEEKAAILYDYLDSQNFYKAAAAKEDRSLMNVTFRTGDEALDAEFVKGQAAHGFSNLKGHRLVGGMRASIYNAMPKEGVEALVEYMKEFAAAH